MNLRSWRGNSALRSIRYYTRLSWLLWSPFHHCFDVWSRREICLCGCVCTCVCVCLYVCALVDVYVCMYFSCVFVCVYIAVSVCRGWGCCTQVQSHQAHLLIQTSNLVLLHTTHSIDLMLGISYLRNPVVRGQIPWLQEYRNQRCWHTHMEILDNIESYVMEW